MIQEENIYGFKEWITHNDEHAESRLRLLDTVSESLNEAVTPETLIQQKKLADKLERWRYHILRYNPLPTNPTEKELLRELDLLSNRLAGDSQRPSRSVRLALAGIQTSVSGDNQSHFERVENLLDSDVSIKQLTREAIELTETYFSKSKRNFAASEFSGNLVTRTMLLYAPLYLSNFCTNHCLYCGFRYPNKMERSHLNFAEAIQQAEILIKRGFRHLLLVAGDFPRMTSPEYFSPIIKELSKRGITTSIEIAPQSKYSYHELIQAGTTGVTLYQETYDEELYAINHPLGSKALFDWRLEGPERAAEAGVARLGLGLLLGLGNPKNDMLALIRHGRYLQERFPQLSLAFSLPRIHEAPDDYTPKFQVSDDLFIRYYALLRIAFPRAHLVLSTRENIKLRSHLAKICISQMSAGSSTAPGGYETEEAETNNQQQFPVSDQRTPDEVASWLEKNQFVIEW